MLNKSVNGFVAFILIASTIAAAVWVFINRQFLIDEYRVMQYQPTTAEVQLRDDLPLTNTGERYYNASHTRIQSGDTFNASCGQNLETNNPILGCYAAQDIFVYDITNDQLDGIEQTTAAHEVLHAAYERLPAAEKSRLDSELLNVYDDVKTDELEQRMEYYRMTEPGQQANELHSILATEFRNLSPALERHYEQFFDDRGAIVDYYEQYERVFQSALEELSSLQKTINSRAESVNARITRYNQQSAVLQQDTEQFNQNADSGVFDSEADFNTRRQELVARQDALEAERQSIQAMVAEIEQLREQYNDVAASYNELNRSINSSLAPTPVFN